MNIGELSRLSGLPVKTIRYYSDVGLVPEAERSRANYRRYDHDSLVRLEFVRTLRELGLDIATIKRVLDRGEDLGTVAAAHAEAIGVQIRVLRLRRAALRAVARRDPTPAELDRMTRIAQASTDERRRIVEEFFDSIFAEVADSPEAARFTERMRSVSPDLPDDPTDAQVDAWIELAEMLREQDFRARLREMGKRSFAPSERRLVPTGAADVDWFTGHVAEHMDAGVTPGSPKAGAVVDTVLRRWGLTPDDREELVDQLTLAVDPRAERYWQLMAVINGWPPIPATMHRWQWFLNALRAGHGQLR
ncbi:MerR family transcriptional regulator [Dactylosporangium aurantiacum]|uniref:MerR family transcriptional regulator n=1 Tax=Dactylosporangium aurantiacum TaxID=35754 RepID=A0A9Q9ILD9_9ACTN|nr:MerR family transcriptional regulator [Dactylosporangium aurantiacum]MDG6109392.1 MerR family transcriptional regulator [Dactylosporangium aurantiacum]UWZ55474.1 MerR family transcriptional regulator [Dactylosporangium aurantiacum]